MLVFQENNFENVSGFQSRLRVGIILCFFTFVSNGLLKAQAGENKYEDSIIAKYSSGIITDNLYYLASVNENNCIKPNEIKIQRRFSNNLVIIKREPGYPELKTSECIQRLIHANNRWKLSASLEEKESGLRNAESRFIITANDIDILLETFRQKKIKFNTISVVKESQSALIGCKAATFFTSCLPEPELLFADLFLPPSVDELVVGYKRNINKINFADLHAADANGLGISIGIKEKLMDTKDIDLQNRVQSSILASAETDRHATITATLAGGAGNSFYTGKGVAHKCNFFPSGFANLFPDSSNLLIQKNVTVQNHSYGTQIQSFYGAEAVGYDLQTFQQRKLIHIFSSGNRGNEASSTGTYANLIGFANLTGNFKMAKNVIAVAAVDTSGILATFSSSGPLFDGRMGPQITALGPNGTSEAAAIVSGAAAVLQQVYKDSNAQVYPDASLIKAVLFNGADDIGKNGIDYRSGFGLLNVFNSITCIREKKYDGSELMQSEVWTKNLTVPPLAANLKVTLVWTDTAAQINTNKALVNDLDLELVELNTGLVYKPWQLSLFPGIDSLNKLPVRKRDSLNTAEQISIDLPVAGVYQVRVIAKQIQTFKKQDFHIAFGWDTLNSFRFTNPVHASDIDRKENPMLAIEWNAVVADTNTVGNISISFDSGNSWQAIVSGVKLNKQHVKWPVPDTSAISQLRMTCSFGSFYSNRFIISPFTKLHIDYRCSDSIRLSWQKHIGATGYQLFSLGDTAYMKPVLVTSDTFVVLQKNSHPQNIFAVQALLYPGLTAARSEALDISNQSVDCFYRSLNAFAVGDSVALDLSMSFLAGVSSIEFEKLSKEGIRTRSIESISPAGGQYNYQVYDNQPDAGINYYRAKITINGTIIYTETVTILHNGKKPILVYPNPVRFGGKINFSIKEKLGAGSMQIIDVTGKEVSSFPMSITGENKTANWLPGLYIFIFRSPAGKVIETGKFIIQ